MSTIILYLGDQPVQVSDSLAKNYLLNGYTREPIQEGTAVPVSELANLTPKSADQFEMTGSIDVNSALPEELSTIPGIGVKLAKSVIDNRPYAVLEDLIAKVKGVDWLNLLHLITIIPVTPAEPPAPTDA